MATNDRKVTYIATVLLALACLVTLWRLVYRYRSRFGLSWGDGWAAFAMLMTILYDVGLWITTAPEGAKGITREARVATFYYAEVGWTSTIWAVRLSILCTVIHIAPTKRLKTALRFTGGLFVVFVFVLLAQKFWVCVPQKEWTQVAGELCDLGEQTAILEIVTDVIGDAVLVLVPSALFWSVKGMSRRLRIRFCAIFSMSFLTTVFSLWQIYYLIHPTNGISDILASDIEVFVALGICNLGVLVAAMYKIVCNADLEQGGEANYVEDFSTVNHPGSSFRSEYFNSQQGTESGHGMQEQKDHFRRFGSRLFRDNRTKEKDFSGEGTTFQQTQPDLGEHGSNPSDSESIAHERTPSQRRSFDFTGQPQRDRITFPNSPH